MRSSLATKTHTNNYGNFYEILLMATIEPLLNDEREVDLSLSLGQSVGAVQMGLCNLH